MKQLVLNTKEQQTKWNNLNWFLTILADSCQKGFRSEKDCMIQSSTPMATSCSWKNLSYLNPDWSSLDYEEITWIFLVKLPLILKVGSKELRSRASWGSPTLSMQNFDEKNGN